MLRSDHTLSSATEKKRISAYEKSVVPRVSPVRRCVTLSTTFDQGICLLEPVSDLLIQKLIHQFVEVRTRCTCSLKVAPQFNVMYRHAALVEPIGDCIAIDMSATVRKEVKGRSMALGQLDR
jgi:hypothetical protein